MEIMKRSSTSQYSSQSGSAIFIILIGIALFAALSFVVAQSLRVTGDSSHNMDREKMALQMTELTQFFEAVKVKANTMIQVDSTYDLTLSFKNDTYKNGMSVALCRNDNPTCTDPSCMVFSPENPQGVVPVLFNKIASAEPLSTKTEPENGHVSIGQLAIDGVGSPAQDLVLIVNGVSPQFCNYYNETLGITLATPLDDDTTLGDIGESSNSVGSDWGGCATPAAFDGNDVFGEENTNFAGHKTFCSPRRPTGVLPTLGIVYVLRAY
jgi:hypothetical protein